MSVVVLLLILIVLLFCFQSRNYFRRMWDRFNGTVPPGPPAFPILGTIAIDPKRPDKTFRKWAKQYGSMVTFFLGDRFCLAVNDMELIRKLLKDDRLSGRSQKGLLPLLDIDIVHGIVLSDGELWKEQRRFSLTALRDFGFGKQAGEDCIQKEAAALLQTFKDQSGQPFNPRFPLANAVSNVIAFMLFGDTFEENDNRFKMFVEHINKNLAEVFGVAAIEVYPWLRHIPPFTKRFQGVNDRVKEALGVLKDLALDHKKSFDNNHIRDYIDAFYSKQASGSASFTDEQLVRNLGDLYIAGFETTTTFLKWSIICMIKFPHVQRKVQAEIDKTIGQRFPNYTDKPKCPYTDAVITEIFRFTSFIPFGVPHRALEDVQVDGYCIPKDTEVWPILTHCFSNPQKWKQPEEFMPERFLDNDERIIQSLVDEVQPFSVGKRACLGEPLARMEVFVFFAAIVQNFTLLPDPENPPSMEPVIASILGPQNFEMIARPRA
ncbi:cytochrome P450 2C15-like [Paramacrobiotus metropolitanus]|uniref:cytochrome P450 2C15-like n=1 Tax=Paramacrobiotus metropolitanus TaxID=2943436 RepID=UPI0024456D85|nr:cytochrome P450 2C15-like [Paramacrobiotus metropolitanus]